MSEKIVVKSNSVLELRLKGTIKDYAPKSENPFDEVFGFNDGKMGLNEILNAIENAKDDTNISGISIQALGLNAGISQTKAIRDKIEEFKTDGQVVKRKLVNNSETVSFEEYHELSS